MNDIAPEAKRIFQEHIKTDVYGAYTPGANYYNPYHYKRRGLMESGVHIKTDISGLRMMMTDETPGNTPFISGYSAPSGTQLSEIVDKGLQGNGHGKWPNAFPRPYVENTQEEVNNMVIRVLEHKYG